MFWRGDHATGVVGVRRKGADSISLRASFPWFLEMVKVRRISNGYILAQLENKVGSPHKL